MQLNCETGSINRNQLGRADPLPNGFHIDSDSVHVASGSTRVDVSRAEFWPLMELMSAAALRLAELQAVEKQRSGGGDSV